MSAGLLRVEEERNFIVHPYKFNLWLFILTVIMVFGGLTSAYIVARASVDPAKWDYFSLPTSFWVSTAVILFSSLTVQFSVWAVRKGQHQKAFMALLVTLVLGIVFLVTQFTGFEAMVLGEKFFVDPTRADDSVSFFYIFVALHGLHIFAALLVLLVCMWQTLRSSFKSPKRKILNYEITATFWHFLDLLWVYLFVFLLLTQSQ